MSCPYADRCGGCVSRQKTVDEYQKSKEKNFRQILAQIKAENFEFGKPIFVPDGTRRRASMAFLRKKGKVVLGFNEEASKNIVDCETCALLTPKLNEVLPFIRNLLNEICAIPFKAKKKGKDRFVFGYRFEDPQHKK